jgi:hypothetical protein
MSSVSLLNLKVLTIKQPWATLIINGYKNIENRTWGVSKDRWILVHSSAKYTKVDLNTVKPEIKKIMSKLDWKNFPVSQILGIMHVSHVEKDCDIDKYIWATGTHCWHIDQVIKFEKPITAIGAMSLWTPSPIVQDKIRLEIEKYNQKTKEMSVPKEIKEYERLVKKFCDSLNMVYLDKLAPKYQKIVKKLVTEISKSSEMSAKVKNKLQFEVFKAYYNYPRATIISQRPNVWQKSQGFIANSLNIKRVDEFQNALLEDANKWFHYHLGDKNENLNRVNLSNMNDLKNMFDPKWKNNNLNKEEKDTVRKALNGGGNAQFHPYKGWRYSGFGIWNHIRGSKFILLKVIPKILKEYKKIYRQDFKFRNLPHIIFKPPSDKEGKLLSHNDSGNWNDMYTRCTFCKDTDQWVENYGIQSLVHLKGAKSKDGGHTTLLGPMDIHTYFIILHLVHPKTVHEDMPKPKIGWDKAWLDTTGGPNFYDWYNVKVLKVINRVLKFLKNGEKPDDKSDKKWVELLEENGYLGVIQKRANKSSYEKITKIQIVTKEKNDSPYLISWPNGFIHGSDTTGKTPRLTITVPIGPIGDPVKVKRVVKRLRNIAKGKMNEVLQDKDAYEGGIVHTSTKTEVEIYPFFKDLYIDEKGIDQLVSILEE